jgi:hypothetical protein
VSKTSKDGFSILGLGAAACIACCAGPILAFLGGLSLAGAAATWFIGGAGLVVAGIAAVAYLYVRTRRSRACATDAGPVQPVELTRKASR